tara:strand:- start:3545 stop:4867 length:1323 start_codon:yes stop_codon:yes gene_type:complete
MKLMINKFLSFIKHSYHRPTAKFEHFCVLIFKLFLNNKTKLVSEKMMLLKFPPISMVYFNSLGRFFYALINFLSIILFGKFFDKSLSIEKFDNEEKTIRQKKNVGDNLSPWPPQAIHNFEDQKEVSDDFLNKIFSSYEKAIEDENKEELEDSPWWTELRKEFQNIFLENKGLNKKSIRNFRNDIESKSAILKDQNVAISKKNSKFINMINATLLACLYHKYSEIINLNTLRTVSDSYAGNNSCVIYRGQRLNHRILRYSYYISQLKDKLDFKQDEKITICDIGGGFGGLLRLLKNTYLNSTCILVELPETCLLASYFLKKNFPDSKILLYSDFNKNVNYKDYDIVILPQNMIKNFEDKSIDLVLNTSSLSEMKNETQDFYLSQIERVTKKYFYSVNRHKYKMHKYNAQGFYNLKFKKRWNTIIYDFTHTFQLEFLGKVEE